jgi:hypothetical protein
MDRFAALDKTKGFVVLQRQPFAFGTAPASRTRIPRAQRLHDASTRCDDPVTGLRIAIGGPVILVTRTVCARSTRF